MTSCTCQEVPRESHRWLPWPAWPVRSGASLQTERNVTRAVCFGPSRASPRSSSHYRDLPGCVMGPEPSRKVAFDQDSHSDLSVVSSLGHLRYLPRLSSGESPWDALGLGPVSTTCGPWPRRTLPCPDLGVHASFLWRPTVPGSLGSCQGGHTSLLFLLASALWNWVRPWDQTVSSQMKLKYVASI